MAGIYDYNTGEEITVGIQGSDICDEAVRIAAERGEPVHLEDDDGGDWIVNPNGTRCPVEID